MTPVVRIAEIEIHPEHLETYRRLLTEEIEVSLALENGVLMLHAVALQDRPEKIVILESYADRQSYEAHLQTPHFLKYKAATAGMIKSLALRDVDPVAMRAKPAIAEP